MADQIDGIDRFELESSLNVLRRATMIQSDKKMMDAIGEFAKQESIELNRFSPDDVPNFAHPDRTREGKLNF